METNFTHQNSAYIATLPPLTTKGFIEYLSKIIIDFDGNNNINELIVDYNYDFIKKSAFLAFSNQEDRDKFIENYNNMILNNNHVKMFKKFMAYPYKSKNTVEIKKNNKTISNKNENLLIYNVPTDIYPNGFCLSEKPEKLDKENIIISPMIIKYNPILKNKVNFDNLKIFKGTILSDYIHIDNEVFIIRPSNSSGYTMHELCCAIYLCHRYMSIEGTEFDPFNVQCIKIKGDKLTFVYKK